MKLFYQYMAFSYFGHFSVTSNFVFHGFSNFQFKSYFDAEMYSYIVLMFF